MQYRATIWALLAVIMSGMSCSASKSAPEAQPQAYRLVDAMPEFWKFFDDNEATDDATWLREFRARVIEPHASVYALTSGGLDDASLLRFRTRMRADPTFRSVSDSLPALLAQHWSTFSHVLSDMRSDATLYVLPAPALAIGGWYRPLPEGDAVVFGFESLARMPAGIPRSTFIHHELMHLYHAQVNPQIRASMERFFMGRGTHETALYELLSVEGLGVHASLQLTPGAKRGHVMNAATIAANEAARASTAQAFRDRLDATDQATIAEYMYENPAWLPPRAAYYLGLAIAEHLAQTYTLSEMARLESQSLREAVTDALDSIAAGG